MRSFINIVTANLVHVIDVSCHCCRYVIMIAGLVIRQRAIDLLSSTPLMYSCLTSYHRSHHDRKIDYFVPRLDVPQNLSHKSLSASVIPRTRPYFCPKSLLMLLIPQVHPKIQSHVFVIYPKICSAVCLSVHCSLPGSVTECNCSLLFAMVD